MWDLLTAVIIFVLCLDSVRMRWHLRRLWKDTDSRLSEEAQERRIRAMLSKRVRRLEHRARREDSKNKPRPRHTHKNTMTKWPPVETNNYLEEEATDTLTNPSIRGLGLPQIGMDFVSNWSRRLLETLERLGHERPLALGVAFPLAEVAIFS